MDAQHGKQPNFLPLGGVAADINWVTGLFLALAWISVLLRVYVRAYMIRFFGWDDWLMLLSLVGFALIPVRVSSRL